MAVESEARWMPVWLALIRTHTRLWEQIEAQMRQGSGLTMARYDVLAHLDMAGGRAGLTELASSILLSQSGLSKLLDRMAAAGLVRRDPDPRDGRAAFAAITPQGRSLVRQARHNHHEFLRQTFAKALNNQDLIDLARVMERLSASIPVQDGSPSQTRQTRSAKTNLCGDARGQ
jgi:DNA-binding MarR family transcriptional regulator